MSTSDLDDLRQVLYAGPRATFLERRKAAAVEARGNGDREQAGLIAKLRKPSAAAHLVNLLAEADDEALDDLIDLGAKIREAFKHGDDVEMRELLQRRAGAIKDTIAHARAMARSTDESLSAAVTDQITQTLRAAMASSEAAGQVRRGTLTDALDDPGFASLGVAPPPRRTPPPARRATKAKTPADTVNDIAAETDTEIAASRRLAEQRAVEAAAAAALEAAERELAAVAEHRVEVEAQRKALAAQLAAADDELAAARAAEEHAEHSHGEASAALEAARAAFDD